MPRDITKNWCRERKQDPKKFDKRSFRVKKPNKNTRITLGCVKGEWNPRTKKCNISLELQSIARRKIKGKCPTE